jgi:hypothetical protein
MEANNTGILVNKTLNEKVEKVIENASAGINASLNEEMNNPEGGNTLIYILIATAVIFLIYKLFCKNSSLFIF